MECTLYRHAYLPTVTLGRLYVGSLVLATLEEPWIPNPFGPGGQRRSATTHESCIPDGSYTLYPHTRPKTGAKVWVLENTFLGVYRESFPPGQPFGRTLILIHTGNSTDVIEGCILVGMRHGQENGKPWVYESTQALERLRAVLSVNEQHKITIAPTPGTSERGVP